MEVYYQFILQNAHFALNIIAALIFFAIAWLYFDSWTSRKGLKASLKWVGFFIISLSFVLNSIYIEQTILINPLLSRDTITLLVGILKVVGYGILTVALLSDHLQERPKIEANPLFSLGFLPMAFQVPVVSYLLFIGALLAIVNAFLYLRRATIGLENHLKIVSAASFFLSGYEVVSLGRLFQTSDIITISQFTSSFGGIWLIANFLLFISTVLFAKWIFGYLVKRIQTQLFMFVTAGIITIFLITTVSFTFLLFRNIQNTQLKHLMSDVGLLQYAFESKRQETLAIARLVAANQELAQAILNKDRGTLREITTSTLLTTKNSSLLVVDENSTVLMRAEDPERFGGSLTSEVIVQRALQNELSSTVATHENVLAPIVSIRSAAPVIVNGEIVGAVIAGIAIDNAFVDGIKNSTELDTAVYASNIRSATTFLAPDGRSRWIGVKEESTKIQDVVLKKGQVYSGELSVLNIPYLVTFAPLRDSDNNVVGMLFVGKKHTEILQTVGKTIELTFLLSTILLILSIFPAYIIARNITKQIS
ncbi:MAG TPA: cache domain-containing protein [Patescibacteria group bacterium]|nr:cache domain-containing protein [Patescibacteria group bacterium]